MVCAVGRAVPGDVVRIRYDGAIHECQANQFGVWAFIRKVEHTDFTHPLPEPLDEDDGNAALAVGSKWDNGVVTPSPPPPTLRTGKICYLEIPALDVHTSAAFYERVFGWNIRFGDTDRPSFDDTTGEISGA